MRRDEFGVWRKWKNEKHAGGCGYVRADSSEIPEQIDVK